MKNQVRLKLTPFSPKVTVIVVGLVVVIIAAIIFVPLIAKLTQSGKVTLSTTITNSAPIGIAYGDTLLWDSPVVLSQTLDDTVALGATTIRLDLGWDDIQPNSASVYNWGNFDRVVQAALLRHLTLLPTLAYTPVWARPPGCRTAKCAPANPNAFATFAAAAASRYAPMGIHTWEIWNEPNSAGFWQPTPNVAQYVYLLSATSSAIRAVDIHAFIVSAGLAPTATSNGNIAPIEFFGTFANLGGISLVDAIGAHPYSYPVPPAYKAAWNAWQEMGGTTLSIESILIAHGAASKKIWITEYGAPTNGPGAGATPTNYNFALQPDHVNETLQAQMANASVRLARSSSYIGALYWYSYKDLGTNKSSVENFFGLLRFDGSVKPAWQSLQQAIVATNKSPAQKQGSHVLFSDTQICVLCYDGSSIGVFKVARVGSIIS
jgi:polysaccharide biosynthesis protein PslG